MKLFLLLMCGGLCRGDLLNLGYLPPPGAEVSGGSDGVLDVPLETPFETPQSSFQRNPIKGSLPDNFRPEDKKTYGTTPSGFNEEDNFTAGTQPESVNVPTTTTSFAFTQTTTFSPLNEIQCDEPHCISENIFPTSSFSVSQIPNDISQKISNTHTPQSNVYKPIPQFQSSEIGSATPGPFSNTYRTTFQPNHDSSQTQVTVDSQSPSTQSFPPGSIIGSFQPQLNESFRPGGIAPFTQLPSGKENYVNNFPGTSALPQFTRGQSVFPAGITVVPMSSFNRPGFGTQTSQHPGAQVTDRTFQTSESDNIPMKDGQPGDKYVVPGSLPSITSPKIFSQQPIIPPGFPNVPTSGAITVIPTDSSEGLTSGGQIQYPGSYPIVPGLTVGAPGSHYNKPYQAGSIQPVQPFDRSKASFDSNATILKYDNVITPEGYFSYSFDTSNGIHADESGDASDGVRAEGAYSYTGDDGQFYSITYTADENGYQPKGDHLPTPPPIPEAIQRVIEQSTRDKAAGIIPDQGLYNEDKYGYKKYDGKLGQDSPITTQTSAEIGSNNINTRRPIPPGRRPSNSGISPNYSQPPVNPAPGDVSFGQTTLRPTFSNNYDIPDQGIDRKIGSHKPSTYLPEYSTSPTIYKKPFDYKNQGIPTATGENYGEIRPNIPQSQSILAVGSRDQTEQGEPGDQSFPINTIPNLTESQTTSTPNLFRGTGAPALSKNARPIQQKYDQYGQPISNNNYPSKPSIPIKKGQHYGSSGRPVDEKNASIILNKGKIPERVFDKKNYQFIQRNGPSGIRDGMPSEQGNDGRVHGQGGTDRPNSEDVIVPVEIQYDNGVYRGNSQIRPVSSPGVTTSRPTSYFTDKGSRIPSANEFVKGEDSTNAPIANQPQEFYKENTDVDNRFPPLSEMQGAIEKVNAGIAMTKFVPSPSNDFPQRQQTNAIVRPYDRTITRPISGYKYEVPSQRFDIDVTERYQPEKKVTSFGQGSGVSVTLEDSESESTVSPSSTTALEDVYQSTPEVTNSGIVVRPSKKPGRPSPGSAELFNITPDTLDTTVTATDSPLGQRFSATSPRPKPVTTSRGNIRYQPVPSEVPTIIPDGSKRVNEIPEFPFSTSKHTTSTEPAPFGEVQGEFVTFKPEYNQFSYKQNIPQSGTTAEDVGIYGTAPTQTYGQDFVQAQPSTPKTFQVPKTKPQHTYTESQFLSSTLGPEDAGTYLGYTQDYQHSSTIKPLKQEKPGKFESEQQRPGQIILDKQRPGQFGSVEQGPEQFGHDQQIPGTFRSEQQKPIKSELDQYKPGQFGSDQQIRGQFGFGHQKPGKVGSDQQRPGKFRLDQQEPGHFGSDEQLTGQFKHENQKPEKFGSEQQKPDEFRLNQQRPGQFGIDQQRPGKFGSEQQKPDEFRLNQQRPGQFGIDQQRPGKFGSEQQRPELFGLYKQIPGQFGSDQPRREQFGFGQLKPGKIGSEQQRSGVFGLDQQGPGQFGSDQKLTGQFNHDNQKPGKFGSEQQKPAKFGLDQQGPGQYELDQQRPGQFGSDQQSPGEFGLDQQRPGTFVSEQQRPSQFELEKQRPGQFGSDQQSPGEFGLDQQRPGTFVSEQQRPSQFELEKQRPGQFGSDQQSPGKFGLEQQRPGKFVSEQQRPGQFGLEKQRSGQFGSDQQTPGEFGLEQQRPGKFVSEQQRPGQFGLEKQRPGQFGADQQRPGEFGLDQQRPGKFGSEQQIPGQFRLDKQRPGQFGSDQQESGQFGSRVTSFPKIKGEIFSPSRKPPSYDAETGYHY